MRQAPDDHGQPELQSGQDIDHNVVSTRDQAMKKIVGVVGVLALFAAFTVRAAEALPDALVKSTVDEVLSVIKQNKDKRTLHDLAEQKVLPHFDFEKMTRLAVGRAWRDANPAQRKALVSAFRSLLVSTYTAALSQSSSTKQTVEVKPAPVGPGDEDVTVKTVVKESGRPPIPIDYRMSKTPSGWKVYDVVVENLSLVTNYRSSFNSEINRSGLDGLIKALEAKNKSLDQS